VAIQAGRPSPHPCPTMNRKIKADPKRRHRRRRHAAGAGVPRPPAPDKNGALAKLSEQACACACICVCVCVDVWMCPMLLCTVSRSGSYGSSCCRSAPVLPQRPRSCGPSCARRLLVDAAIHLLCPSERLALRCHRNGGGLQGNVQFRCGRPLLQIPLWSLWLRPWLRPGLCPWLRPLLPPAGALRWTCG